MKIKGTRLVKLADLKTNLFVRKELDQDRVLELAALIEHGTEMKEPIEVTDMGEENSVVDGRHRKDAYELNGVVEVRVKVIEFEDQTEMIAYAYKANTGGSKPPTAADTEHTVMLLLERGETKKRIGQLLGLPAGLANKYINEVKSKTARAKLLRAKAAVVDGGLTAPKAAEQYKVDVEKLKEELQGKKRRQKQNGIEDLQRKLTQLFKSVSQKNAAMLRNILAMFEDADVNEKQVGRIFDHLESLQKQSARATAEWKKRFEALRNTTEKVAKIA